MLPLAFLFSYLTLAHGEKLLFTQLIWRHGLRTPTNTYANDPYNEAYFGMPEGELLPHGMEQHFIRGQQLRQRYGEDEKLVSAKYSRYETYVRSADYPRCSQSALANMAGFYADSPTFPTPSPPNWPSGWTPLPIHTVPTGEDYIFEAFGICPKLQKMTGARIARQEFQDFVASQWRVLATINANSGDPPNYTFYAIVGMYAALNIEKNCNLTLPDWVTPEFFEDLQNAYFDGNDYTHGEAGFGLPMDPEMTKLTSGFLLAEWMNNIDDVINNATTLKYYAYSGHDLEINALLVGLGMKQSLIGLGNTGYASTVICELWEKEGKHYVKLLYSKDVDSAIEEFTSKLPGCGADLCLLSDFQAVIQPLIANDTKICLK